MASKKIPHEVVEEGIPQAPEEVVNGNGRKRGPRSPSIHISFTEPEDVALYESLKAGAKKDRRPVDQYVLLRLHETGGILINE